MLSDPAHIAALDRLLAVTVTLHADMITGLAELGLPEARARVVWELNRRGPMTQKELAAALGITPRGMTGLIDGLVATGFVTREPHPNDRRAVIVTFTAKGSAAGESLQASQAEFATRLFSELPDLPGLTVGLDHLLARFVELGVIQ